MKQTLRRVISAVMLAVMLVSLVPTVPARAITNVEIEAAVDAKVKAVAAQCRAEGLTDKWEIALWLHDWLIYNANYDYTYTYYHPEGVLLYGTGVCQSYAEAYKLLLNEFSIPSVVLHAPEMDHAWNLVYLNEQWCHVDCTWDDPGTGGEERRLYFGMNDELMLRDHQWDMSAYPSAYSDINYYYVRNAENAVKSASEARKYFTKLARKKIAIIECIYVGSDPDFNLMDEFRQWYNDERLNLDIEGYSVCGNAGHIDAKLWFFGVTQHGCTHKYLSETLNPTCTEGGYTDYICLYCLHTYTGDYTKATGHSYVVVEGYAPTCTKQGLTDGKVCENCGKWLTRPTSIDPTGHTTVKVPAVEPTCTTPGNSEGEICTVCNEYTVVPLYHLPLGHLNLTITYGATCTEGGYSTTECLRCHESYVGNKTEALGHDWQGSSCTEYVYCRRCGKSNPNPDHAYTDQYDYKCNDCGQERTVDMTRPMVDMYRMYNPNTGEHFYTGSTVERYNLISVGWQYEGIGFTFPLTTGAPVHRLFQPSTGEHLYTMDEAEKAKLMAEGWNYEGIAFNSGFENEVPQFRLHNPNATVGAYHFTASTVERDTLIAAGWEYQGIGWYSLGGN